MFVADLKYNCAENYIGETGQNVTMRRDEHCEPAEPVEHLYQFPGHSFNLKTLKRVPNKIRQ